MPSPPGLRLLARLLLAGASVVACNEASESTDTGQRQSGPGGSGGSGTAGSGTAGSATAGSGGSAQGGQGGSTLDGCAGEAPTCELKCSDAWPPASCIQGKWTCPGESSGPNCQPLGGVGGGGVGGTASGGSSGVGGSESGGSAGTSGGTAGTGNGGTAGTSSGGSAGTGSGGAAGSGPLAPCWAEGVFCGSPVCYPKTADEVCLEAEPTTEEFVEKLGCEPNAMYPVYLESSDPAKCCYGVACPGGRPFRVEGALTHAATTPRGDWG
jgi:hypothetical protein